MRSNRHLDSDSDRAMDIMDRLDFGLIEEAALKADFGEETCNSAILMIQTEEAYQEMSRQLKIMFKRAP